MKTAPAIPLHCPNQAHPDPAVPLVLIRLPEVLRRTALGRTTLYTLIKQRQFPAQISLGGGKSVAWVESEVEAFIQSRIDAARKGITK